tara:strand:+ start:1395 stop:1694 length:300 start_codon:yes stop_codon:yes gene_type:complete
MWKLFCHFLTTYVQVPLADIEKEKDTRWSNELNWLNQGIRDSRISDNSLAFLSWYQSLYGKFEVGESELWEDVKVTLSDGVVLVERFNDNEERIISWNS